MRKIIIIGPLPPPIHGESLAINYLVESGKINELYNLNVINTSRGKIAGIGKFSLKKVIEDFKNILSLGNMLKTENSKPLIYISISQTRLGLLRDLLMIFVSRKKAKKIILHLHGNKLGEVLDNLSVLESLFAKAMFRFVSCGIVLGEDLKSNFQNYLENIKVVSNGIEEQFITKEDYNKRISRLNEKNNESLKIVYLSNLMKSKGYNLLIEAVQNLNRKGISVELNLAGAIQDQGEFKEIFTHVDKDKIKYCGIVTGNEKKALLLNSDVMVLPSAFEGQPLSIIEGMASGLPIIATNVGAIPDLVKDNGIILNKPLVHNIEEAITKFVNNKDLLVKKSKKSRRYYTEKYTLDQYIENVINIFEE